MVDHPSHNVIFKVFGKNGILIEQTSVPPAETEVLFKLGTTFAVESVEKGYDYRLLRDITEIILKEK